MFIHIVRLQFKQTAGSATMTVFVVSMMAIWALIAIILFTKKEQ